MTTRSLKYVCLTFLLATLPVTGLLSCDTDRDCGVGICIKREKRASGICYGLELSEEKKEKKKSARSEAIELMGDPNRILKEHFPDKKIGKICIVNGDCAKDQECVHAGFEGHCIAL